ncbi:hypothetical protein [uncultured Roseibium sp.]|uniref:hypothetical protein n=1 Tax=uncultured Roseibium sp. TaxID=1936171 RepID=UPI0026083D9F|nr:hypothetical protein [uncultured Roseibium sp.]
MRFLTSSETPQQETRSAAQPELLFLFAIAFLMLMSLAVAPLLALPLIAFVAMVAVTRQLGLRLYNDLTGAIDQDG